MIPRPRSTDCPTGHCAGFDPDTVRADRYPGPPLDEAWQGALDGAIAEVKHMRCGVEDCGNRRCDTCGDRMVCTGPEPRACGTTCVDCPCDCTACQHVREDMRAELLRKIEKEAS